MRNFAHSIPFAKYHGLGNDYIVVQKEFGALNCDEIVRICDVHFGIGCDGILVDESRDGGFAVKILNPDGSQAEKSGNGLRIFSRYLFDNGLVKLGERFEITTLGGLVNAAVIDKNSVKVEMGKVLFETMNEKIAVLDREFIFCGVNIGNPHCVIVLDEISPQIAKKYGALIETDKRFINRTNVQFMKIVDKNNVQIEIWERGAGYTLASGSSGAAAAAVAYKSGLCENEIYVAMPGGKLSVSFDAYFNATIQGGVQKIAAGEIADECFE
ncbi:MAG: diaminopimelate epimerase [Chitinispirillales bacterium]|jgi:diaminopimelate epimerase|nr:diaminopimelate epimerase [Chitinispirillales bacterium]